MPTDHLDISDLGARPLINICGSETYNNVDKEKGVDKEVQDFEEEGLEGFRAEAYIQWDHKDIEGGQ